MVIEPSGRIGKFRQNEYFFSGLRISQIQIRNKYLIIFSLPDPIKHKYMCKQKTGTNATAYDLIMQSFIVKLEKDKYFLFQTDTGCSMGTVKNKKIITQPRKHSIMVGKFY